MLIRFCENHPEDLGEGVVLIANDFREIMINKGGLEKKLPNTKYPHSLIQKVTELSRHYNSIIVVGAEPEVEGIINCALCV